MVQRCGFFVAPIREHLQEMGLIIPTLLGVAIGGGGTVTTTNGNGKELVSIGVSTDGIGLVTAYDPSGRRGYGQLAPRN
jgi:hypothetical protein